MTVHPIAKINLGLNIVSKRPDGYHNLETVFFPVALKDTLTLDVADGPSGCQLEVEGIAVDGDPQQNLVVKAYRLLAEEFSLPRVSAELTKRIPTQAGMGGGSSDCAYMLMALNDMFRLGLNQQQLIERAKRLGADCPFFILSRPAYAEGIGERLQPVTTPLGATHLLAIVKPPVAVSTREAFSQVCPRQPERCPREVVTQVPIAEWPRLLTNDFEQSVFALHPSLDRLKQRLYDMGAAYAAMSGSGSAMFGIFALDHQATEADRSELMRRLHSTIPASCQLFAVAAAS